MIRGHHGVTSADVAAFYDEATELISTDLGGSLHFGYWRDLPPDATMADAALAMTRLVADRLAAEPGQRVLDIGCGSGRAALDLARIAGVEVVGIDISSRQVELATALAKTEGMADRVRFQQADATYPPFAPGSFDAAWLLESFFHMADQVRVLRAAADLLRPGGRLAIGNLVLRTPLSDERDALLREDWRVGRVAALVPLAEYPRLILDSGLELEEVIDVSDDSIAQTFRAIAASHVEQGQPIDTELADQMGSGAVRLAATPEFGFAVITARKP